MPWFRFIGEAKHTLHFKNGEVEITFANLGGEDGWAWVAQKKNKPTDYVILLRRPNVLALRTDLMLQGFEVPARSVQERIMRAAETMGYAEELPDDPRWRHELILARGGIQGKRTST